ncbi:MAG: hypothetical protein ACREVE_17030, partial [Gammaproteobacteria bacterium]
AQMGRVELPNEGGHVRVVAGEYNGVKGPAVTVTPINLFDIFLRDFGCRCDTPLQRNYLSGHTYFHCAAPPGYECFAYVIELLRMITAIVSVPKDSGEFLGDTAACKRV